MHGVSSEEYWEAAKLVNAEMIDELKWLQSNPAAPKARPREKRVKRPFPTPPKKIESGTEPMDLAEKSLSPMTLGLVNRVHAAANCFVERITFDMHAAEGQCFSYEAPSYKGDKQCKIKCEYLLDEDELILSAKQFAKKALGQIVLTTSKKRNLVFKGTVGLEQPGKLKERFFECQEGHQIHSLEFDNSVLVGIQQIRFSPRTDEGNYR